MQTTPTHYRQVRSFVRRDSRLTSAQEKAIKTYRDTFILSEQGCDIDFVETFGRNVPTFVEIGFGTGQSLLEVARLNPVKNFIGIETHKPGIGAVLLGIQKHQLTNLRLIYADASSVLEKIIPKEGVDGFQIFFPDPWPKRKHHGRRLIQTSFLEIIVRKLKQSGSLHLATDWEDYAQHMLKVTREISGLETVSANERSIYRPIVTKFEQRAIKESRRIFDFQFQKK